MTSPTASTARSKLDPVANGNGKSPAKATQPLKVDSDNDSAVHVRVRLRPAHRMVFAVGLVLGFAAARNELIRLTTDFAVTALRGYEYDAENDCIVVRKRRGNGSFCRAPVDCAAACKGTTITLCIYRHMVTAAYRS